MVGTSQANDPAVCGIRFVPVRIMFYRYGYLSEGFSA
jgi:hypothetical protein